MSFCDISLIIPFLISYFNRSRLATLQATHDKLLQEHNKALRTIEELTKQQVFIDREKGTATAWVGRNIGYYMYKKHRMAPQLSLLSKITLQCINCNKIITAFHAQPIYKM